MPKVTLSELNQKDKTAKFLKEINLSSVPTKGDKITLDIDGIGYVFNVIETHYTDNLITEIFLKRISNISDYMSNIFNDR